MKRFLVPVKQKESCYLCLRPRDKNGYTNIKINYRQVKTHRLVYFLVHGNIPEGMVVRHSCNNPQCINPKHLILGTHADNVRDRVLSDRSAKGTQNGRAKLTESKVRDILNNTQAGAAALARKYKVSYRLITLIRGHKLWQHLR
jgi:hypothetical protein